MRSQYWFVVIHQYHSVTSVSNIHTTRHDTIQLLRRQTIHATSDTTEKCGRNYQQLG